MKEPFWLQPPLILSVQKMLIREHGGLLGIRDEGALNAALSQPLNLYAYETPDLYALAAAYADGMTQNHPFVDGNKRIAFMAAYVFLERNRQSITLSQANAAVLMKQLAAGEIGEEEFAEHLRSPLLLEV